MTLDLEGGTFDWHILNPLALLWYVSSTVPELRQMLLGLSETVKSNIVIYCDELTPGNVLRPDKGRTTMAFYWTVLEWPSHLLKRVYGWFTFGVLRSTLIAKYPGGLSALFKKVLHVFFPETGPSLLTGVALGGCSRIVCFGLGGIIGDEKAIKEIYGLKGAAGCKPCLACKSVVMVNRGGLAEYDAEGYLVGIDEVDSRLFDLHTDESVFQAADVLAEASRSLGDADLAALEVAMGVHHVPDGVLLDQHLRGLVRPITGTIWDWMHILLVHGTGSLEVQSLVQELAWSYATLWWS